MIYQGFRIMLSKFRLIVFIVISIAANQVSAQPDGEDNSWWWDDHWWNDGLIETPENFAIESSWTSYMSGDVEVSSLVLRPANDEKYPAVLFVHGRRGLDDLVKRHARRLAARGFVVLAPDIYGAHFLGTHPIEHDYALEKDIDAAVDVLLERSDISTDKACLYSHTRGGYYTLKVATTFNRQDKHIACYVSYYPHLQDPNAPEPLQVYGYAPEIEQLTLPTLVFIGDEEQYQRRRVIETSIKVMQDKGRNARLIIYPGVGRGFDFRPKNVRTFADDLASKDSIQRSAKFMRDHLTGSTSETTSGGVLTGEALYNSDKAPQSMLYDLPREVAPGVWSAIGATAPGTYANSGHNNNLSFVITDAGVLVVNAGDNYLLAKALHEEIRKITDQPVRYVVLENGQGHAMLGSSYWQEQGVPVIAHIDALHEIEQQSFALLERMQARAEEKAEGTKVVLPDETFEDKKIIQPERRLVISGDMAFHQRMLPLFEHTDSGAWIETWDKFEALGAEVVIPGHGEPTDMATVRKYTRDYLVFLREKVAELIENGGTLEDAYQIDQSPYMHLPTAEFLAKRNAGQVFQSMEFDF
jgi:carboxymethylenebutenolidase